jgi:hypothetical protein
MSGLPGEIDSSSAGRSWRVSRLANWLRVVIALCLIGGSLLVDLDETVAQSTSFVQDDQTVYVTTNGLNRYLAGRWGTLAVEAVNRSKEPASINSVAWIEGRANEQFGRSVWLPAESHRSTWKPIFVPLQPKNADAPNLYWMGVRDSGGTEVLSTATNQDRIESRQLMLAGEETVVAIISDNTEPQLAKSDLLRYVCNQTQFQTVVLSFDTSQLPMVPEALDAVTTLVVMGDGLAGNAAAIEAVQDWVREGGTLWLMLDTMSAESSQAISGGDLHLNELDRVSLTSYSLASLSKSVPRNPDVVHLERPVQLVRTFVEEADVLCNADEWPAVVVLPFGQGRVFASMLSLDGWFVPRTILDSERVDLQDRELWVTTGGQDLMSSVSGAGFGEPLDTEVMTEYVTSRIGYQLPVRSSGAVLLASFCLALIVVCGVAHRRQKPAFLMPGIAVLSLLAVSGFLVMATSSRTTTDSAVTFQMVEATGMQDRVKASGVVAFHSRESSSPEIQSTAGGMLRFNDSVRADSPVRMVWSDQHVWQLKNAKLVSGVRLASYRESIAVQQPVVLQGTFNESGFEGRLLGEFSHNLSDAVLADQTGFSLPVEIDSEGEVSANGSEPLPPGQYLAAGILNAEQSRRQNVYRQLFDVSKRRLIYPERPTLLAWSDPLKLQTGRFDVEQPAGAMLISVPIHIERPEAGTRLRIPSTFLPYRSVRNPELKIGFAPTFSNSRRTWSINTVSGPSKALLRFEIPVSLLPLSVDQAKLTIKISAPLREVEILSGHPGALTNVWSRNSPVGRFEIPFPDDASRKLAADGGFHVAVKVGSVQLDELEQTEAGTQDRNWQIEWIQLEIEGLIQ